MKLTFITLATSALLLLTSCGDQTNQQSSAASQDNSGLERILKFDEQEDASNFEHGRRGPNYPRIPGGGYGRTRTVTTICKSKDYRPNQCNVNGMIVDLSIVRQLSDSACIYGRTFGARANTVWVRRGCQAIFRVEVRQGGQGGGQVGRDQITCESNDYRVNSCRTRYQIRTATIARKLSRAACVRGRTYGFDNRRVWVSNGCRAVFNVFYR